MNNSILQLFEGLTTDQAKELRRRIVPALEEVRREVITIQPNEQPHKKPRAKAKHTSQRITSSTYKPERQDASEKL